MDAARARYGQPDEEETPDDGFLEALKGRDDWEETDEEETADL